MQAKTPMQRLWKLLHAERKDIYHIYGFAIFQGLVALSLPLGIQAIITFIQAGRLSASWLVLVIFVVAGIIFTGLLQLRQLGITESIEQRMFVRAAFDFAYRTPRVAVESVNGRYVPELMNRFFEVATVQKGMSKLLIDFAAAIIQVLFGLLLLSLYHPLFILLGVALLLLIYLIFRITGPGGLRTSLRESNHKFAVAHWLQEVARTMQTFKLAGSSSLPLQKTDAYTQEYLHARNEHFIILMRQYKAMIVFKVLVAAALLVLGSVLVVNNRINIGQFVAAEIVILLIISSVEKIILNMSTVYDVLTALDKLGQVADLPLERHGGHKLDDHDSKGLAVSIRNMSYRFADAQTPVLRQINLEVASGENVCIVGPNGSGKTTLLRLLSGYYTQCEGIIAYNGLPLSSLDMDKLRVTIGENYTENEIFRGTLLENITCGRQGIGMEQAREAIEKVNLSEFVQTLPDGYNTLLDPQGQRLPGGIVRKLILARCFAIQPRLLLIEDNMSTVPETERQQFFDRLFEHNNRITTVLVTQDTSLMARCHNAYQLNNGELVKL